MVKVWNHSGLGAMRLNCAGHKETYSRNCCRNQQYHYSHATRALWCHESPETQPPTCSGWQQRQDQSSALLVVCGENPLVTTGFRYQRFIKMFKAFLCHNVTGDSPLWKCALRWRHNGCDRSQITSLRRAHQRKHQSSASLAFVWGIHRRPVNSPHKWPVTRKMFPFDDVIMSNSQLCNAAKRTPRPQSASFEA